MISHKLDVGQSIPFHSETLKGNAFSENVDQNPINHHHHQVHPAKGDDKYTLFFWGTEEHLWKSLPKHLIDQRYDKIRKYLDLNNYKNAT